MEHDQSSFNEVNPMDRLLAKLSEQQAAINKQHEFLQVADDIHRAQAPPIIGYVSALTTSSPTITPATTSGEGTVSGSSTNTVDTGDEKATTQPNTDEILR